MLDISKQSENGKAFLGLKGELDTRTAGDLAEAVEGFLDGVTDFTIDMEGLVYITSAGLRVLLKMAQQMDRQGDMRVLHVNEDVMDVFEVSGFTEVLTIE